MFKGRVLFPSAHIRKCPFVLGHWWSMGRLVSSIFATLNLPDPWSAFVPFQMPSHSCKQTNKQASEQTDTREAEKEHKCVTKSKQNKLEALLSTYAVISSPETHPGRGIFLCGEHHRSPVYLRLACVDFLSPPSKVNCSLTRGCFLFSVLVNCLLSEQLTAWHTYV